MRKRIRLHESDLYRVIRQTINEAFEGNGGGKRLWEIAEEHLGDLGSAKFVLLAMDKCPKEDTNLRVWILMKLQKEYPDIFEFVMRLRSAGYELYV